MSDWPIVRFEELAADEKSAISKPYGSAFTARDYVDSGVPMVRGANLGSGRFIDDGFVYISDSKANQIPGANLRGGDLVFTHRGVIGQVAMIPHSPRFSRYVLSTSQVKARLDPSIARSEFYLYWFLSPDGQRALLSGISTVGVPGLAQPVATIKAIQVPHPPLKTQRAITDVLGALDDKIVVNNRIAETSKNLGQAIFASHATVARKALQEVCSIVMGQSPPGDSYNEAGDGIPFYQGTRDFGFYYPGKRVWCTAVTRHASVGDILVSVRAPVGDVNVASDACGIGRGLAALRAHTSPHVLRHALLFDLAAWSPFEGEGTVFSSINKQQLHALTLMWPAPDGEARLEPELCVLDQRIMAALNENESLSELRDTLLPELTSGLLRVKDAEKVVEEAV
jgi:type I restriction enzyme, S subunit